MDEDILPNEPESLFFHHFLLQTEKLSEIFYLLSLPVWYGAVFPLC